MALHPGNLLGAPRAEADSVTLEKAFVETKDFLALVQTDDFNFVVGRRGTGKSALFRKLAERISERGDTILITLAPEEHEGSYSERASSDFALLETPTAIFDALYGVGFLGIKDAATGGYRFCHDGAPSTGDIAAGHETVIHPCYWKSLGSVEVTLPESVVIEVNDEYRSSGTVIADFRVKQLGTVVSNLSAIPVGHEGQSDFETWVFRAVKLLYPGPLSNIELKPNGDAIQRRDVVATNVAQKGFWKRILDDYRSRQIVFEMKNFAEIGPEEFRQLSSYLTGEYGNFGVLVTRRHKQRGTGMGKGDLRYPARKAANAFTRIHAGTGGEQASFS